MQQIWPPCKVCDACQTARATVETNSGFFLCEDCAPAVVIAFREFEIPAAAIGEGVQSPL